MSQAHRRAVMDSFAPRGHQACGGILVRLECNHILVLEPGQRIRKAHVCVTCVEIAGVDELLRRYLPPRTK